MPSDPKPVPQYLRKREAVEYFGLSPMRLERLRLADEIVSIKPDRTRLYSTASILAWLERQTEKVQ